MARKIKEAKPAATTTGVDEFEVKSPSGPAMVAKTPIVHSKEQREKQRVGEESMLTGTALNKFPRHWGWRRGTLVQSHDRVPLSYRAVC